MSKTTKSSKNFNLPSWLILSLILLAGLLVRLLFISKANIWHDEGFSIMLANRDLVGVWLGSARDVHPPLYYFLLHFWIDFAGSSEVAIRSLSTVFSLAAIPFGYLVVKQAAGKRAGYAAAIFLSLGPFLVRYSQEARMYGILSLFLILAVYFVTKIVQRPKIIWPYVGYALAVAAAVYTHYFTFLAVGSIWLYLMLLERPKTWKINKTIFLSYKWWLANITAAILFLPWLPNMLAQLTRGQGLGWLSPTNIYTYFDSIWQFLTFTDGRGITLVYWIVGIFVLGAIVWLYIKDDSQNKIVRLLVLFTFLPIAAVLAISFVRPIFHIRYFVFSAFGFYMLVAIFFQKISAKRTLVFWGLSSLVVMVELIGIRNVYSQATHKMGEAASLLNKEYQAGDLIVSGELYTYFDASFYNQTGQVILLYTGNGEPNGFGESGLLYDQKVYINSFESLPVGGRFWVIGKTGDQKYFQDIPGDWKLLEEATAGYSVIRLYQIQ